MLERLQYVETDFVYHMDNECYKSYVMKKTVDKRGRTKIKENGNEDNHDLEPQSKCTR